MRRSLVLFALLLAAFAALPAQSARWGTAVIRDAIASAEQNGVRASVSMQYVDAYVTHELNEVKRFPRICVAMQNADAKTFAGTCRDVETFTMDPGLRSARARGSFTVPVMYDLWTRQGETVIRYDVQWVDMGIPAPRSYTLAKHCGWTGWQPGSLTWSVNPHLQLISFGSASGTISSSAFGTVAFNDDTLTWDTFLGEGAAVGAQDAVDTERPSIVEPGCHTYFVNTTPPRVMIDGEPIP